MSDIEKQPTRKQERTPYDQIIDKLQRIPPARWGRFSSTAEEVGFKTMLPNNLSLTLTREAKTPEEDENFIPCLSFAMYRANDDDPLEMITFPVGTSPEPQIAQRAYGFFQDLDHALTQRDQAERAAALAAAQRIFANLPPKS